MDVDEKMKAKDVEKGGDSLQDRLIDLEGGNATLSKRVNILERDLERKTDEQVAAIEDNEKQIKEIYSLKKGVKEQLEQAAHFEKSLAKEKEKLIQVTDELNIKIQEIDSQNKHLESELRDTCLGREDREKALAEVLEITLAEKIQN